MQLLRNTRYLPAAVTIGLLLPAVAYAARDLRDIICQVVGLLNTAVPIIVALALLFFFWGLARFILHTDSEEERKKGKQLMIWGVVALFVMLSIFGLVQVLLNTFFEGSTGGLGREFGCAAVGELDAGDEPDASRWLPQDMTGWE